MEEKYSILKLDKNVKYSVALTENEIFRKYGRPKYHDSEPDNSELPGWTKGF